MKTFHFVFRNPMSNVNHLLCTDIPSLTLGDIHPDDQTVAQEICDFAASFDICAQVVSEFTRNLVVRRSDHYLVYDEVISINDKKFFIVGKRAEIAKLDKEKIPTFIPKK